MFVIPMAMRFEQLLLGICGTANDNSDTQAFCDRYYINGDDMYDASV